MSDECEPDPSRDGSGNVHDNDAAAAERRIASAAKYRRQVARRRISGARAR